MQKVIGLDIGSYSIKAIEIVNTFKSYEITNFYETVIAPIERVPLDAIVPVCMEQLFVENDLEADRIITAMPGQFVSSRVLPFNFSDTRKIEASIQAELEEQVPFNLEDMIIDSQILGTIDSRTFALAVMTRKAFLKNFLDLLSRINIDPKLVDIDSLAFYNLASYLNVQDASSYAMIDVGHEKTSICIICDGVLRLFRSINLGGRYITDFLSRDLEISFFEAQRIKHSVSQVFCGADHGSGLDTKDRKVAERSTLAANAIVKELGRTLFAFKTWDQRRLNRLYLSGGTSRMTNFDLFLQEQLEVEVEKLRLDETNLKINEKLIPNLEVLPQSLAIGMRTVSNIKMNSQINLRRGEFAYTQNYESILKGASAVFKVVTVILGLLLVSYLLKSYFYDTQMAMLEKKYRKEFLVNFPELRKKFKKKSIPFNKLRKDSESQVRTGINETKDALADFQLANSGSGALITLQEISQSLPKELTIDVNLLDFKTTEPGKGRLVLRAETDNFSTQSAILDSLRSVRVLKNIEEKDSGTKPGSEGKKIEFTVHADYQFGD